VARVSVIAVFTASTLAMLGMKAADTTGWSRKANAAVAKHSVMAPAAEATSGNVWEKLIPANNGGELLADESAVQASAFVAAPTPVFHRTYTRRM
jgi:hypothetical protein